MKHLLTVALFLIGTNCFSQVKYPFRPDWIYVTSSTDSHINIFLKNKYVSKEYDGDIKIWTEYDFSTKKVNGKIYKNIVENVLYRCDCKKKQLQQLQSVTYSSTNQIIDVSDSYDSMEDVVPSSVGESILDKVCELFNK